MVLTILKKWLRYWIALEKLPSCGIVRFYLTQLNGKVPRFCNWFFRGRFLQQLLRQFYGSCTVVKLIYGAETHSPKFPMSLAREPQYSPLKNVSSGHLLRTLGHTLNVMTVSGTKIVKTNRSHWLLIKYYIAERREKKHQNTSST